MATDDRYIVYRENQQLGVVALYVFPDGRARLWRSLHGEAKREIGYYETNVSPSAYQGLLSLKRAARLEDLPMQEGRPPGTSSVSIDEQDGERSVGSGFWWDDVPAVAKPVLAEAVRIVRQVQDHPRRVLGGVGAPSAPAQGADGYLRFEVKLRSVGTEPVEFENPLAQEGVGPEWTGLRLLVDPAPGAKTGKAISADLTPQNVKVVDAKGAPTKERWLLLAPGEEARLSIRRQVHASPGRYHALVECRFGRREGGDAANGLLTIDLGTFEVLRPGKAK
jgi:hypothetical protein